jgi:hypothetical protein
MRPNSPLNPTNRSRPLNPYDATTVSNPNSLLNPLNPLNPNSRLNPNNRWRRNRANPANRRHQLTPTNPANPSNPVATGCSACGAKNRDSARFCRSCGQHLVFKSRHRFRGWAVTAILLAVALGVSLLWLAGGISHPGSAIRGTTSGGNVRAGPGVQYQVVAVLPAGSPVLISCRAGSARDPWLRLKAPHPGRFIGQTLVRAGGAVPAC